MSCESLLDPFDESCSPVVSVTLIGMIFHM